MQGIMENSTLLKKKLLKQEVLKFFPNLLRLAFMMMVPLRITIPWSGFSTTTEEVMDLHL